MRTYLKTALAYVMPESKLSKAKRELQAIADAVSDLNSMYEKKLMEIRELEKTHVN